MTNYKIGDLLVYLSIIYKILGINEQEREYDAYVFSPSDAQGVLHVGKDSKMANESHPITHQKAIQVVFETSR